jgi:NAD(P)-dependent dehydrogenase (short-subunit alcohol dehydrogenase family)
MPSALVTGASRGIGRATTQRLVRAGWNVVAGVRREADGKEVVEALGDGVRPVVLDITDTDHIAALRAQLPDSLDAVVNNAGVVVGGPVEALPLDELRRQLEVNVIGQVAVTQAVMPLLRSSRGRVVFVSSLSGRIVTPMTGAYNASKFAIEAIADALRMELWPWRIAVSVVEPAQTDTDMWRKADDQLEQSVASVAPEHRELYAQHIDGMRQSIPKSQRLAAPADRVAETVLRALTDRRPRPRYIVGAAPRAQFTVARLMPTAVLDSAIRRQSGITRRSA